MIATFLFCSTVASLNFDSIAVMEYESPSLVTEGWCFWEQDGQIYPYVAACQWDLSFDETPLKERIGEDFCEYNNY